MEVGVAGGQVTDGPGKLRLSPEAVAAASASSILIRLVLPKFLVRAAALCIRWLRVASVPVFLGRLRRVHPPGLLASCRICPLPPVFLIELPDGVENSYDGMLELSGMNDSKFYLIHVKGALMLIWLHDTGNDGGAGDFFDRFAKPAWMLSSRTQVMLARVGDNAGFVYSAVQREFFLMHIGQLPAVFENWVTLMALTGTSRC
uniref:F-box protein AT5G49610-like beta-propeller domain-containing protein n=1 Tax=Setaria viridis TaxID=4556 RepID=A0A4U6TRU1_SETVI|nr:hypothetical protein SEVIR_7G065100v2 [Setaria viridis]